MIRCLVAALGACAALAGASVQAQRNLSFEQVDPTGVVPLDWSLPRVEGISSDGIAVDHGVAHDGGRSLRIAHSNSGGLTRVSQRIAIEADAPRGGAMRMRLSGYLRGAAGGDPALWLAVDGPGGFLVVDSRGGDADGAGEWVEHVVQAPLPEDAREIVVGVLLRGAGTAWFDALSLDTIDARSLPPPSAAARRYVLEALDILEEHSIRRRSIDWLSFRAATLEQARGASAPAEAYLALRYALRNLADHHSYLVTPQTAAALSVAPVSNARTGREPIEPQAALLDGAFGYLSLPGFAGGTQISQVRFAEQVQSLIKYLDISNSCGWILDLRANSGGNLWPMLAGVGPLLGEGEAGASVYPDGSERAFWYRDGQAGFGDYVQLRVSGPPHRLSVPAAPVAVLVGPRTASSAEVILIALQGRPSTLSFGSPTAGVSAGNRTFPLSDGAALVLTVAATRDRAGRVYHGAIAPDRTVAAATGSDDRAAHERAVLDAAVAWLKAHDGCRARDFTS